MVLLTCAIAGTAPAHTVEESAAGTGSPAPLRRPQPALRARDPAAALAKRLDLNAQQTAEVRRLLLIRRSQVRALWTDNAIAADDRVGAIKAINDKTEAQIRALLTEEQRKGYFLPRPSGGPATGSPTTGSPATDPKPSVEDWLKVSRPRQPDSSPVAAPDSPPR